MKNRKSSRPLAASMVLALVTAMMPTPALATAAGVEESTQSVEASGVVEPLGQEVTTEVAEADLVEVQPETAAADEGISAISDSNVAKVDDTEYATVEAAIAAANGETVYLIDDVSTVEAADGSGSTTTYGNLP